MTYSIIKCVYFEGFRRLKRVCTLVFFLVFFFTVVVSFFKPFHDIKHILFFVLNWYISDGRLPVKSES